MRGNILTEARKFVKSLYADKHDEVFVFSIKDLGGKVEVQTSGFDLENKVLEDSYKESYDIAENLMDLAKSRFKGCKSIVVMISDEVSPEVFMSNNVLHIFNLNID